MVLVGNTDDIFSDSSQNSFEDIHLPAQVAIQGSPISGAIFKDMTDWVRLKYFHLQTGSRSRAGLS